LALENISISSAFESEIRKKPGLRLQGKWDAVTFNKEGNLVSPFDS